MQIKVHDTSVSRACWGLQLFLQYMTEGAYFPPINISTLYNERDWQQILTDDSNDLHMKTQLQGGNLICMHCTKLGKLEGSWDQNDMNLVKYASNSATPVNICICILLSVSLC